MITTHGVEITTPISKHAIEQFQDRVSREIADRLCQKKVTITFGMADARLIIYLLTLQAERSGGKTVYETIYRNGSNVGDIPITLVIRDGYVVTCWVTGKEPKKRASTKESDIWASLANG